MDIDDKEREKITNLGVLNYKKDHCAIILDWDKSKIDYFYDNPDSEFWKHYNRGQVQYNFNIDMKLFALAKDGDHKAIETLERKRNMANLG